MKNFTEKLKHCSGCESDFYNGNNPYEIQRCWNLEDAKIITRYRIRMNIPMNLRSGYTKVKTLSCKREKGYVFLDKMPDYAR